MNFVNHMIIHHIIIQVIPLLNLQLYHQCSGMSKNMLTGK